MTLSETQRGVLTGMAAAAAITVVALPAAALLAPAPAAAAPDRLALAARLDAALALPLAAMIAAQAKRRFFSAPDINAAAALTGTEAARVAQAVIQNTLEQAVLAALAYAAFAATAPASWLPALAAAAALFVAGRALFWAGYRRGAAARALGFGLTFYPTLPILAAALALAAAA